MRIRLQMLTCQRCGWRWLPRKVTVRACPNCHSILWDLPYNVKRRPKDDASR